jgi:hypothetical protein
VVHDDAAGGGEVDPRATARQENLCSEARSQLSRIVQLGLGEPPSLLMDLLCGAAGGADADGGAISEHHRWPPFGPADHFPSRGPRPRGLARLSSSARSLNLQ